MTLLGRLFGGAPTRRRRAADPALTAGGRPRRQAMPVCESCQATGRPLTVRRGRAVCMTRCR